MFKASGTVRGWLPPGTRFSVDDVTQRLVDALRAEGAGRLRAEGGVVTFDGGTNRTARHAPLQGVQDGDLRVSGVAPTLDAMRAEDVQYRVEWRIRTPGTAVLTLMFAALLGGLAGSGGGVVPGLVVAALATAPGWIAHFVKRFLFARFLRRAVLQEHRGAVRPRPAASAANAERPRR